MNNKPTIAGFNAYVLKRGNDDINNHHWSTCALGCYLGSIGINVMPGSDNIWRLIRPEHSHDVKQFYLELMAVVITTATCAFTNTKTTLADVLNDGDATDYKQLAVIMDTCEVEL